MVAFQKSNSHKAVLDFLHACADSMVGATLSSVAPGGATPATLLAAAALFPQVDVWAAEVPLHPACSTRYGNTAFRDFMAILDKQLDSLLGPVVCAVYAGCLEGKLRNDGGEVATTADGDLEAKRKLTLELRTYFVNCWGNATRIDFGTGHELHFLIFLMVLMRRRADAVRRAGLAEAPWQEDPTALRYLVVHVFWNGYMASVRKIQDRFRLEPAGSHGVWGLDDFHHAPYIFGAAQLVGCEDSVLRPKDITNKDLISRYKKDYIYCAMIDWINEKKKGPMHEHSSILFNVSGLEEWVRILSGMIKMYEGEVLGRWVIVQHLLFGDTFPFA